jgi:hypothetical protein
MEPPASLLPSGNANVASEPGRRRDRGPGLLALASALTLALSFAIPAFRVALHNRGTGGIHIGHAETLSLTTYGRWWVWPPHHFMTDAFSGDLATFYNFLSDSLLNLGSAVTGLAPMTFQALVYGPLLGFLFVWLGYVTLAAATGDRWTAALAAAIAAFTVDPGLDRAVRGQGVGDGLTQILHVPFHALGLGNGQSLGWVLFFPALCLLFTARERFTPSRAAVHGACLGLLFLAHTLTFVNVAGIEVAYLTARRALLSPRDRPWTVWAVAMVILAATFVFFAWIRPPHTFATLAALGLAALAVHFATDPDRRFYLWSYLPAGLVVLPYLFRLANEWRHLSGHDGDPRSVELAGLLFFFVIQGALAAAAARWAPRSRLLLWAVSALLATLFLAENHRWAWGNHPYRFAINLVFPLAVLAALGLRHAPRPLAAVLGLCFAAAAVPQVVRMARNEGVYLRIPSRQRLGAFLSEIRKATDAEPDRAARILNPPEFHYPEGTTQSALILNASSLPGFVPDYRYVLWPERHRNRLALFCFLFPYPHEDGHTQLRACDDRYEPTLFEIADPRIRTAILPVYRIRYAASIGAPFNFELPGVASENQWPLLATTSERHFLYRVDAPVLPGLARASRGVFDESGFRVDLDVAIAGRHLIVLGGRGLLERAPVVRIDGHEIVPEARDQAWMVAEADLSAGRHSLALPHTNPQWQEESDFLYFLAAVDERQAGRYFRDRASHLTFGLRDGSHAPEAFDEKGDRARHSIVRSLGVAARGLRSHPRT